MANTICVASGDQSAAQLVVDGDGLAHAVPSEIGQRAVLPWPLARVHRGHDAYLRTEIAGRLRRQLDATLAISV